MGCNSSKKVAEKNTPIAISNVKTLPDSLYRLSVSFISIGSGIDRKMKQRYDVFIAQFEQIHNLKLDHEIVSWGREGETDYCFKLIGIDARFSSQFIAESKELLSNSTLIRIKENTECRQRRK